MKDLKKVDFALTARRRVIIELIDASFALAEKIGPHPVTRGCNCISCAHKRKRALKAAANDWRYSL